MSNPTPEQAAALEQIKAMQAEHAKKALLNRDVSHLSPIEREAAWHDQYTISSELRAEFKSLESYLGYKKAQFRGLTR